MKRPKPVERTAAGGRHLRIRVSWAAAIAHFSRSLRQSPPPVPELSSAFPLPESGRRLHALKKLARRTTQNPPNPAPSTPSPCDANFRFNDSTIQPFNDSTHSRSIFYQPDVRPRSSR
jgi:hypothetical protein